MKYISVCSGIEAASVAWHPLGWQPLAFSEIEPFPRAVLAHHYPDVPLHGDFTKLRDEPWIVDADVLVGGTPCQAFSVAGLRNSLADERGNLSLEYVRLADAIDDLRLSAGRQPAICVWENVPGVLSVKDNAFGCFLAALAGDASPYVPPRGKWTDAGVVDGPARKIAWRILDAQYFGLAQRRRRVFVVASAREGFDPAEVLFEFEGVQRHSPPSRETGQVAPTIPSRSSAGGGLGTDFDLDGGVIRQWPADIAPTLNASFGDKQGLEDQHITGVGSLYPPISQCLNAGGMGRQDAETETLIPTIGCVFDVAHTLKGEGFDASEDGTGRGTPLVPVLSNDPAHAICANEGKTYTNEGNMFQLRNVVGQPVAYPINTQIALRHNALGERTGMGIGEPEAPAFTLQAGHSHAVAAYAFQPRIARNGRGDMGEIVNALNAQSGETGKGDAAPCVAVQASQSGVRINETVGTLNANYGSRRHNGVMTAMQVRRLTPVECERLQGFPDNYTLIPWRNKAAADCPDGPRYKALGNSMAVPCMRWIGERIAQELDANASYHIPA